MFCLNRESCLMGGAGSLLVDSLGASRAVRRYIDVMKNQFVPGFFVTSTLLTIHNAAQFQSTHRSGKCKKSKKYQTDFG